MENTDIGPSQSLRATDLPVDNLIPHLAIWCSYCPLSSGACFNLADSQTFHHQCPVHACYTYTKNKYTNK